MFRKKIIYFFIGLLAGGSIPLHAQLPVFHMPTHTDTTVLNCKGEFYDSDAGANNTYLAQAQDTFRICTGGTISMSFQIFQLENGFDTLFFYNGTTISAATLIGKFTGNNMPTGIVANGCLTILFKSSFVLQDIGWKAQWTSTVLPPVPPTLSITPVPSCSTTTVDVLLSKKVHCDSVYASAFTLTGPITTTVTAATAIGCIADSTTTVQIQLSTPLTQSCDYNVNYSLRLADNCDSIWTFILSNTFTITNCPLTVSITATANDTTCIGSCVQLKSVINACLSYNYYWSHGLPNATTHTVCPSGTTTYTLGVQSTSGGPIFTSSITITVIQPQINSPANDTVCQSDPAFNFSAVPSGGTWTGNGITDSILGTFDPDTSGPGTHFVYYKADELCRDSFALTVLPMDAGLDEAACPGSPDFSLSGFSPAGGTWSGYAGLTPAGVFSPSTLGTFTVVYTHSNGCTDYKQVFVQPLVISGATDSICQSVSTYTMVVSPPGGRWVPATGIIDTINGILNLGTAGGGMHHYFYKLNGCMDTAHIYIKPVNAGSNLVFCPKEAPLIIGPGTPAGGIWTSIGTSNGNSTGLLNGAGNYNPGAQGLNANFTDTLVYTATNGCPDTIRSSVVLTRINKDSLFFCSDDDSLILNGTTTGRSPSGGVWTGTGAVKWGSTYYFKPALAGIGVHTLTYEANTCSDTIKMVVQPAKLSYDDTTVCTAQSPFILHPLGMNAQWQGTGIVNSATGMFNPSVSGPGNFSVIYSTKGGCKDTIMVHVYAFSAAQINGLNNQYCYTDFNYPVTLVPAGGAFTGPGVAGNSFNPSLAGAGQHQLVYSFGNGQCFTSDTHSITVHPAIQTTVTVSNDTICKSGGSTITVISSGGDPSIMSPTHSWSHGLFSTNTNVVSPGATTTYTITTSDGCSDSKIDIVTISVYAGFNTSFTTSPINCNGSPGIASAMVTGPSNYTYSWSTTPIQTTSTVSGFSGASYFVTITDIVSACYFDTSIRIPGYGPINALFSTNPNLTCVPFDQSTITFIDLSLGATQGYWLSSDGTNIPYTSGQNPQFSFSQPGTYTMTLHVENAGNCPDEFMQEVCIEKPVVIFIPDIFSPNGDGLNDILYVRAESVKELNFILYDRWGEKIFETTSPDVGWDGTFKSKKALSGIYVWHLKATMVDGTAVNQKGDISLVR